jgi:TPR repeat protein
MSPEDPTLPDLGDDLVSLADPRDFLEIARIAAAAAGDDRAAAALARGMELGDAEAMHDLAFGLHQQGRLEQAQSLYERAAELGVADSAANLGTILASRGDLPAAERCLRTAAEHGLPRAPPLWRVCWGTGRAAEARRWATLAVEAREPTALLIFGELEIAAGDPHGRELITAAAGQGSVLAARRLGQWLLPTDPVQGELVCPWLHGGALMGSCVTRS